MFCHTGPCRPKHAGNNQNAAWLSMLAVSRIRNCKRQCLCDTAVPSHGGVQDS